MPPDEPYECGQSDKGRHTEDHDAGERSQLDRGERIRGNCAVVQRSHPVPVLGILGEPRPSDDEKGPRTQDHQRCAAHASIWLP